MDEEETVISKNSPLYSYLLQNEDQEDHAIRAEKDALLEQVQLSQASSAIESSRTIYIGSFWKLWSSVKRVSSIIWSHALSWCSWVNFTPSGQKCQMNLARMLLNTNLLDEDDAAVIRAELDTLRCDHQDQSSDVLDVWRGSYWIRAAAVVMSASMYSAFRNHMDIGGIIYVFDSLVAVLVSFGVIHTWSDYKLNSKHHAIIAFMDASTKLDELLRKALRIIRECEILAKGYTVVTKYTVITDKSKPVEPNDVVPCTELRKCIFVAAAEIFDLSRQYTLEITKWKTASTNSLNDGTQFLLAATDDLEALFRDHTRSKDWRISRHVLQTTCYCMALQRSEFLRVCIVHFNQRRPDGIFIKLIKASEKWNEKLRSAIAYYNDPQPVSSPRDRKCGQRAKESTPIYDYVHSLNLHLRCALQKSLEFEKSISESTVSNGNIDGFTCVDFRDQISTTLRKCHACIDELQQYVESLKERDEQHHSDEAANIGTVQKSVNDTTAEKTDRIYDGTEREIEDQVFEAITGQDDSPTSSALDGRLDYADPKFFLCPRQYLDELKSVLSVRSSIMRERDLKALASRRGMTVEDLLAEEERQQKQEAAEMMKYGQSSLSDENAQYQNTTRNDLSSELMRLIQLKASNHRNDAVILGDVSSDESIE